MRTDTPLTASRARRPAHRLLAAATALAITAAAVVAALGASEASATAPFSAYGTGLPAGATVEAKIGGVSCGAATADAQGQWLLQIEPANACSPTSGATIVFYVNGAKAHETATWSAGGAPADAAYGITLTTDPPAPKPAPAAQWAGGKAPSATGVNLAVWGGGTIHEASHSVPRAVSFFVAVDGQLVPFVVGAPLFVNGSFYATFPDGTLGAGTAILVVIK